PLQPTTQVSHRSRPPPAPDAGYAARHQNERHARINTGPRDEDALLSRIASRHTGCQRSRPRTAPRIPPSSAPPNAPVSPPTTPAPALPHKWRTGSVHTAGLIRISPTPRPLIPPIEAPQPAPVQNADLRPERRSSRTMSR